MQQRLHPYYVPDEKTPTTKLTTPIHPPEEVIPFLYPKDTKLHFGKLGQWALIAATLDIAVKQKKRTIPAIELQFCRRDIESEKHETASAYYVYRQTRGWINVSSPADLTNCDSGFKSYTKENLDDLLSMLKECHPRQRCSPQDNTGSVIVSKGKPNKRWLPQNNTRQLTAYKNDSSERSFTQDNTNFKVVHAMLHTANKYTQSRFTACFFNPSAQQVAAKKIIGLINKYDQTIPTPEVYDLIVEIQKAMLKLLAQDPLGREIDAILKVNFSEEFADHVKNQSRINKS